MYIGFQVKYLLILSDLNETTIFSTAFRKIIKIPNFKKIRPVEAELYHANGRTDRQDENNSRFSLFCELVQKAAKSTRQLC